MLRRNRQKAIAKIPGRKWGATVTNSQGFFYPFTIQDSCRKPTNPSVNTLSHYMGSNYSRPVGNILCGEVGRWCGVCKVGLVIARLYMQL